MADTPTLPPEKKEPIRHRLALRQVINLFSLMGFLYEELDERLDLDEALQKALNKPVPKHVNFWFCFGGTTFLFLCFNIFTGLFLMMYYRPTTAEAFSSVLMITNEVPFGWLFRGVHHWSATLMTVTVLIHMARVFFYGAYKHPRELNWVVGVGLFMVVLGFGFSGYLLPWNQISYWASAVGTSAPSAVPVIGPYIVEMLRGGTNLTGITLTRFFTLHVAILPVALLGLLVVHFMILRRQGIVGPL